MKIVVLGNPIAGGGQARQRIDALAARLRERGHDTEVQLTERAGDAALRARRLEPDVDRLVVVGGDGTLNEALNGLPDPTRVPLAQLPTGTANLLARDLRLPFDAEGTARLLDAGELRHLDMGCAGGRRFLMLVSAGFDALVTQELAGRRRGTLGFVGYARPILRALRRYRPPRLRVAVDGGEPLACGLVIASNTRNYGGLFTVVREARCDSGQLEVCLFTRASLPSLIRVAVQGLFGGVSDKRGVVHLRGRRVSIGAEEPTPVEVDGDYFGTTPVDVELHPRCVPFVAPAE